MRLQPLHNQQLLWLQQQVRRALELQQQVRPALQLQQQVRAPPLVLPLGPLQLWAPPLLPLAQQAWSLVLSWQSPLLRKPPSLTRPAPPPVQPADSLDSAPPNAPVGAFFIAAAACGTALPHWLPAFAQAVWRHR
jgi:hypothetical protein